ncbi:MAG TPA: NADH-quinone oxidoreductase subunit NuoE [Burkholderiaceae bacterium]|nr:NADH-quinone oxidoreductase subunit NuoE [Burkholderiaceae bacterium]
MSAAPVPTQVLSDEAYRRIDREIAKFPPEQRQSAVMAALTIAQDEVGWTSPQVIDAVAAYLGMQPIAVWEVASFYTMYNTQPVGKYRLAVCTNLPCQLRDGTKAGEYLKQKLGVDYNETTADGLFTLKESECLGACGDSPVMLVNNKRMCSFMSNEKLDELLAELKAKG